MEIMGFIFQREYLVHVRGGRPRLPRRAAHPQRVQRTGTLGAVSRGVGLAADRALDDSAQLRVTRRAVVLLVALLAADPAVVLLAERAWERDEGVGVSAPRWMAAEVLVDPN